jgi:hypothetical protein
LGKFWRALDWKMLMYFTAIWNTLRTLGIFNHNLVHFVLVWYTFPVFVSCTKKNLATLGWATFFLLKNVRSHCRGAAEKQFHKWTLSVSSFNWIQRHSDQTTFAAPKYQVPLHAGIDSGCRGDQIILWKNRPECSTTNSLVKMTYIIQTVKNM